MNRIIQRSLILTNRLFAKQKGWKEKAGKKENKIEIIRGFLINIIN